MSIPELIREFRRRWPAIHSILRDGTVIYRANIVDGRVVGSRRWSTIMDTTITNREEV